MHYRYHVSRNVRNSGADIISGNRFLNAEGMQSSTLSRHAPFLLPPCQPWSSRPAELGWWVLLQEILNYANHEKVEKRDGGGGGHVNVIVLPRGLILVFSLSKKVEGFSYNWSLEKYFDEQKNKQTKFIFPKFGGPLATLIITFPGHRWS